MSAATGSRIPEDWPREADQPAWMCAGCGFWVKHFASPPACPVCLDARHTLPARGWDFRVPEEVASDRRTTIAELEPGVWRYRLEPAVGIGPSGYLLEHPAGNVAFEGAGFYTEAALEHIAGLGGIAVLSASHPHSYGALWQLAERFEPEVALHPGDLEWATAFPVTWSWDERVEVLEGVELLHTGGHFAGHAVLLDRTRSLLLAGDALKFELDPDDERQATAVSTHKAFVRRVPLSTAEARRYREVFASVPFERAWTPFEQPLNAGRDVALALMDAQLAGRPFVAPMEIA